MSEVYTLTKMGKKIYKNPCLSDEEMRIINFLKDNKIASEDQLEVAGGERWIIKSLERHGYIKKE